MPISKIRKAVSAIFTYEDKIFFIKRSSKLKAFPGYIAFPGGKSERGESLLETLEREISEELFISIVELKSSGSIKKIEEFTKATSPDFNPLRFETYFFHIELNEKINFSKLSSEFETSFWMSSTEFREQYLSGELLTITPIRWMVEKIFSKEKKIQYDEIRVNQPIPEIENISGLIQLMPKSNTLPPASRTNAFLIGDSKKILVDPSPKRSEYDHFLKRVKTELVEKIFITHHHFDHHENSINLAEDLSVPIYISEDSFKRIKSKRGDNYFREVKIHLISEGDVITQWRNEDVLAYHIPGHDQGHFGLAPRSMRWFIVGDLFQGVGSVVVGGDEGNMTLYMNTLEKVIRMNPKCVIPSHGIPLGSVNILEINLKHRQSRENQIKRCLNENLTNLEILDRLYPGLDEKLVRYAMKNIESHIIKIKGSV